ncbi:MAG TPA: PASTA domain-containing protein [Clostridiales bacterium]|nr:PASTA domain-containing protein [Clostridiales bacterium]
MSNKADGNNSIRTRRVWKESKSDTVARVMVVAVFCIAVFVLTFFLVKAQIFDHDLHSASADNLFITDSKETPMRGSIYSADGQVLAQSNNVWIFYADTTEIFTYEEATRIKIFERAARLLSAKLNLTYDELFSKLMNKDLKTGEPTASQYIVLKRGVTADEMEDLKAFINDRGEYKKSEGQEKVNCGYFTNFVRDPIRYYPSGSIAPSIIGFLDYDGQGKNGGVEQSYNSYLCGQIGRTIGFTDRYNYEVFGYDTEVYSDMKQLNVILNIDSEVQYVLENALVEAVEIYAAEGACGIVMDVNTFDVLGMASVPIYDIEKKSEIDGVVYEKLIDFYLTEDQIADMTQQDLEASVFSLYWANRSINANFAYEPGSVSKILTVAAALEEGVVDLNTAFPCIPITVGENILTCWYTSHHNAELADVLINSCNPFAVQIAQRLGRMRYYDYFEAFGFTEKTGIDLPGESTPVYVSRENFREYNLASYAFGQTFYVTPLQVVSMVATVANGGYLMVPHVVDKIVDNDGNVVHDVEPEIKRQVISNETSKKMINMLERVVSDGSGVNAGVQGYRIAGKTGTSEDLVVKATEGKDEYWASFAGFAPADAPQYALLIIVYKPPADGHHGGGVVAGKTAHKVFEKILPYLNVPSVYDENDIRTPSLLDLYVETAKNNLQSSIHVEVFGEGDIVISQCPPVNTAIEENGVIALYTSGAQTEMVTVPDFTGLSISAAKASASTYGLNIRGSGDSTFIVDSQSHVPGTQVPYGTVINLGAGTNIGVEDG